jgi:hypothetical protein
MRGLQYNGTFYVLHHVGQGVFGHEEETFNIPGFTNAGNIVQGNPSTTFDSAYTSPVANKVQPRAYGVLACVYLGKQYSG